MEDANHTWLRKFTAVARDEEHGGNLDRTNQKSDLFVSNRCAAQRVKPLSNSHASRKEKQSTSNLKNTEEILVSQRLLAGLQSCTYYS